MDDVKQTIVQKRRAEFEVTAAAARAEAMIMADKAKQAAKRAKWLSDRRSRFLRADPATAMGQQAPNTPVERVETSSSSSSSSSSSDSKNVKSNEMDNSSPVIDAERERHIEPDRGRARTPERERAGGEGMMGQREASS